MTFLPSVAIRFLATGDGAVSCLGPADVKHHLAHHAPSPVAAAMVTTAVPGQFQKHSMRHHGGDFLWMARYGRSSTPERNSAYPLACSRWHREDSWPGRNHMVRRQPAHAAWRRGVSGPCGQPGIRASKSQMVQILQIVHIINQCLRWWAGYLADAAAMPSRSPCCHHHVGRWIPRLPDVWLVEPSIPNIRHHALERSLPQV